MRSVWSCSSCAALLFAAVLGRGVDAAHAGPKRDLVHRVAKAQITPGPLLRREASTCQFDYSLCPATLGGGCCPSRYECATDSCYATTAGVTSACGKQGYFACGAADSGGCCPVGFVCGPNDCTPPAGVVNTITSCPFRYFLCPESMNFGCCMSGMGCAPNQCYSTEPVTTTIVQVATTTTGASTVTTTRTAVTIITPTPPTGLPASNANFAPKFVPTSVPKVPAVSSGGGGLTSTQVGGIVGGVVALLVVVVAAAFFIIRRLNSVVETVESKKSSSGGHTKSQSTPGASQGQYNYIDDSSVDPLMITPSSYHNGSGANTPPRGGHRGRSGSSNLSPSRNGFSPDGRHPSLDSAPSGGYFDLPPRVHNIPGGRPGMTPAMRSSVDSHSTQGGYAYQHARNQSNASELSDGSEGVNMASPLVQELDSNGVRVELPTDGRESSLSQNRSRANSGVSPRVSFSTGRRGEAAPFGPLDVVNESAEIMHGYYGPRDRQVGQTAAGLGEVTWDVSSPVAASGGFSREPTEQPRRPEQLPEDDQQGQQQQQRQGQQHQGQAQ